MKKIVIALLVLLMAFPAATFAKGGLGPCLATCCFGPRVGLEMNDGKSVRLMEWLTLLVDNFAVPGFYIGRTVNSLESAFNKGMNETTTAENLGGPQIKSNGPKLGGGWTPFLASCCLGPRIGMELNDGRRIRNIEWLTLVVPVVPTLIIALEASKGKTMTEVAEEEGLDS